MNPSFMAISKAIFLSVFALFWFLFSTISTSSSPPCNETEKHALLTFKEGLYDPGNRLSSWSDDNNEDCCAWNGVRCHNITGRVIELHLGNPCFSDPDISCDDFTLGGKVSPALLQLEFLNYLDLSWNNFGGIHIPSFLGSTRSLTHLYLYRASFGGLIPPNLGNLSKLHYLSIGGGGYADDSSLYVEKLDWISHLSSLKSLVMYDVDLHKEVHWLKYTSMLSSLSELYLIQCQLDNMMSPSSLQHVNFTSLTDLDLSWNYFNHEIPNWLFNLNSTSLLLEELDLSDNSLKGHIPKTIVELRYLNYIDLSDNRLTRQIPGCLGQLKHVKFLSLRYNSFDGSIPSSSFDDKLKR